MPARRPGTLEEESVKRPRIAVFGSSTVGPGDRAYALGLELGRALAVLGADVVTGGYSGTMEAVSRGAHEAGGHVIGVTVELFEPRGPANRWVKERVHTEHLYDRLQHLIETSTGFVVLPGSLGTLTELFLVWTLVSVNGRPPAPIVLLGEHWSAFLDALRHPDMVLPGLFPHVEVATDAEDAARRALRGGGSTRTGEPGGRAEGAIATGLPGGRS
jgi:uncharacterized protein (TIGR00730 family)